MRFIPAYAGNATSPNRSTPIQAVHPRIRGERDLGAQLLSGVTGSSPHTRGTRQGQEGQVPVHRFIPAYAGNAKSRCAHSLREPVHPRIRGERSIRIFARAVTNGSSPHTRGTLARGVARNCDQRFIPAYAGNASSMISCAASLAVHPRIRGERGAFLAFGRVITGSSPHTRGTHFQ